MKGSFYIAFIICAGPHTKSWSKQSSSTSSFGRPRADKGNHSDTDDEDDDIVPTTTQMKGSIRWTDKPEAKKSVRRHKLLPSFTTKNLRPVNEVSSHCNKINYQE